MTQLLDPNLPRLQAVDHAILTPVVGMALNTSAPVIDGWRYQPVHGGTGGGAGGAYVYRFTGVAHVHKEPCAWSLILKIIHARAGADDDPAGTHYWRREAAFYASALGANLPGRLRAPRCFDVVEYADEACWIWQEDVQDAIGAAWRLEHYALAARHLGHFNGAYLTTYAMPVASWLSRDWLRKSVQRAELFLPQMQRMLQDSLLQDALPAAASQQFMRLWRAREHFLAALDSLPQTLSHLDAVRQNLFLRRAADGEYETIAIDWGFAGQAAIGAEIGIAQSVNLTFFHVTLAEAEELDTLLLQGYVDGLRDAGWTGEPRLVRLGMTAALVCKWLEGMMVFTSYGLTDPATHAGWEWAYGHTMVEIVARCGEQFRFVMARAEEARALMGAAG